MSPSRINFCLRELLSKNVQANHKKLSELNPEGMKAHLTGFPGFVGYVQGANKEKREGGFDINKYS